MSTVAPNATNILNTALARIGSTERVTSIDDTSSNSAKRAVAYWDQLRRLLLARHPWNFAIKRAELNEAGTAPAFGWERQFAVPGDCVRWLPPTLGDKDYYDGEREGDYILTNAMAPLPVRYIADATDVTKWSAGFVAAMEIALAAYLTSPVTESVALMQYMGNAADDAVRLGKRIDGLETGRTKRQPVRAQSAWLNARNRGSYGPGC